MKLLPQTATIDLRHRLVSENGLVEMGTYRVLFGWRVRAGFCGSSCCALDWCAGGNFTDAERLYSLCKAILEKRPEDRSCFDGLPPHSEIKPFFLDPAFMEIVSREAGEFELISLS